MEAASWLDERKTALDHPTEKFPGSFFIACQVIILKLYFPDVEFLFQVDHLVEDVIRASGTVLVAPVDGR